MPSGSGNRSNHVGMFSDYPIWEISNYHLSSSRFFKRLILSFTQQSSKAYKVPTIHSDKKKSNRNPQIHHPMASGKARAEDVDLEEEEEDEQFITEDDILAEVQDNGDAPMDEDEEDEAGDTVGDLAQGSSGHVEDISLQHFETHNASVFVVASHPTQPLAVSGGEDDLGYIWDITDGEVIVKLTGHSDSVTSAAWSADGEMISTGGMDGKVRVWRRVGKENYRTWEFLTELQGPDEVMVRLI